MTPQSAVFSPDARAADRVANAIKRRWDQGERADAIAALKEQPGLMEHRSIVIDLAYEEYCQRAEAGEHVEAVEFDRSRPSPVSLVLSRADASLAMGGATDTRASLDKAAATVEGVWVEVQWQGLLKSR